MVEDKTWDKLREMRIKAGKTVPEVSKYLQSIGLKAATQTIYGWERGHSQPTIDTFIEMCRFYGVSDVFSYFGDVPEISDVISISEREHIKKYRSLDPYGKEAVDSVLDVESRRCQEERDKQAAILREQREQSEAAEEIAPDASEMLVYINPAAAGTLLYAESDFERLTFPADKVPRGTDFGIRISGKSMEPTVMDGSIAWVRKRLDMPNGTVGIFMLNDSAVCKRFFKEPDGTVRLESDNPEFGPATVAEFDTLVTVGEVIGTA